MNLGFGVMIGIIGGNQETVETIKGVLGKKIESVSLSDNALHFVFKDGTKVKIFDDGQSCCESRYMHTDDDLSYFANTIFKDIEIVSAPNEPDEWGEHEVQFLRVHTGKGLFTMANHNEHNGYYGGFWIVAEKED